MLATLSFWDEDVKAQQYVCCKEDWNAFECISGDSQWCCTEPNHPYPDCGIVHGLTSSGNITTDPNTCNPNYTNVLNNCVAWLPGGGAPKKQSVKSVENKPPSSEKKQK